MERMDKINQMMKREVSDIIQKELKDPRLEFVTITEAKVTKDLQHAKIYYSVLGNQEKMEKAAEGLNSARGFVRKLVGQRIRMRYTPDIEFVFDQSIEYSARIEAALEEINHEQRKNHQNN